jgi:uncharacterized protein
MTDFDIEAHTIYSTVHGSNCYGTNLPDSDLDIRAIAVPPQRYMLGFAHKFEQQVLKSPDKVTFSVVKFFHMAADCNPNALELIFTDPKDHQVLHPVGQLLLDNRNLFLSRRAFKTFSGYARGQLHRMKSHRSWLLNPPKKKPERADFGLDPVQKTISADIMGGVEKLESEGYTFSAETMVTIDREKRFATALQHWNQYQNWKSERNPARAELERQYGYDTKHGMHLIRLMRCCIELLRGDGLKVRRPDAAELLSIRRGEWSYEKLIEEADRLDVQARELLNSSTALPEHPPLEKLNDLCVQIHEDFYRTK